MAIFGRRGILRDSPDYFPDLVLSGSSARAAPTRGWCARCAKSRLGYLDLHAALQFKHWTMLIGGFAGPNKDVATSLELVRAEFKALAEKGPTQEEVDAAKS